jgi:hypothetical protein
VLAPVTWLELELAALLLVLAAALGTGWGRSRALRCPARALAHLARRPARAPAAAAALALLLAAALSLARPPVPAVHDEFSYLLAADTFARGRLANPPHPLYEHFETFHVIQRPSYASKYPPVQGLFLALGQRLGSPIAGAWLATGLAAAALTWMLQGFVPRRFAALGGLLFAVHPTFQVMWGQSFWGGAPAVLGSALLLGALPRLLAQPRAGAALALALGATVLANTRPYEGLLACLAALPVLSVALSRGGHPLRRWLRAAAPAAALLAAVAGGTAYSNWRTTGDPLRTAYQVHQDTYAVAPLFLFSSPRPTPSYSSPVLERFYRDWELGPFLEQSSLAGILGYKAPRLFGSWVFLLGFNLSLPVVAGLASARPRRGLWVGLALLGYLAGVSLVTWLQPHYFAVALPLVWLLLVQGLRRLRAWRRPGRRGRVVVAGVVGLQVLACANLAASQLRAPRDGWPYTRARLVEELEARPGRHLVLVRYAAGHDPLVEWVYNGADLEADRVVFARELGPVRDRRLLEHYRDRQAWLLLADAAPPRLVAHPARRGGPQGPSGPRPLAP